MAVEMLTRQPGRPFTISPRSFRRDLAPLALGGVAVIALLVYVLQSRGILLLLLAAAVGALGLLCIIRPAVGLAGVAICAALVRVKIGTGTDSPVVASLVAATGLLGAWFLHRALNRKRINLLPRFVALPAVGLIACTAFSMLWGRITLDPRVIYPHNFERVQIAAGALVIVSVGLLFVGADLFRSPAMRAGIAGLLVVIGFIDLPLRFAQRDLALINTAGIFGIWFVALCWANALENRRLPDALRVLLGIGALGWLTMAVTVEGDWVSGWLPPLIAFLGVTVALRPKLGAAMLLLAAVVGAAYYSVFYDVLITQQEAQGSLGGEFGRLELWQRNLSAISGHVLFGTGPAGYALYYVTFFPNQAMSTHSNFVDVLAQFGVGGLLSLIALLFAIWRLARQSLARATAPSDRAIAAVVVGGLPAVAFSLWLGDWLIPFVYNQTIAGFDHAVYSWLMFASACGLWVQTHHASQTDEFDA
ncbi:MAG: hypothetical protein DCC58_10360 [Chloroflexi bacterium]|nr:MAG: hypothetical protein DCC58_10360 [Chloroflexota bacterium]